MEETKFDITLHDGRLISVFLKGSEDHGAFRGILEDSKRVVEYDEKVTIHVSKGKWIKG